jgi:hypothetical protein
VGGDARGFFHEIRDLVAADRREPGEEPCFAARDLLP